MILLIDNYDSFTYNLVDLVQRFVEVKVIRNDAFSLSEIQKWDFSGIIISPGPGKPHQSGVSYEVVKYFFDKKPIFGVCLGHQILAEVAGAKIILAKEPKHGKTSLVYHQNDSIFALLKNPIKVMRYHSLIIDNQSLPKGFSIIAQTKDAEIMAIQHQSLPLTGVQFHPESILTENGEEMVQNWLKQINCI
jgi:anthranilate synthase/aminodeoxychorismate synthase-like glutamine amidotransferase